MLKVKMSWLYMLMALFVLAGCGGGGSTPAATGTGTDTGTGTGTNTTNTTPDPNQPTPPPTATTPVAPAQAQVLTGIFVDAPVEGLTYTSGAQTGATDAAGTFKFEKGGTVQFKVGNVILGQAPAKALMTPLDLVQAVDAAATVSDTRVVQITQFLMTINTSTTATKMTILNGTATAALNETAVNLSQAPVDITPILGRIVPTKTPVTAADALAHIQTTITALAAPAAKAGTFAAVDSVATPTLGLRMTAASNAAGTAFDVNGIAASTNGDTWTITGGTLGTDGSLQATGTGIGTTPASSIIVITGAMTSATQITASANFSLNNVPKQVPVIFEKAVAPAVTGKFGLPADAGVVAVAGDMVHVGADMTINADGTLSAHVVRGQVTGIVALAAIYSNHFAGLNGVVTSTGNIIAVGGTADSDGALNLNGKALTHPTPVTVFTGSLDTVASTAAIKMTAVDLDTGTPAATALGFAKVTNTLVGAYQGTHTDTAPGLPSTFTFAVNNDNSVHGFAMFLRQRPAAIDQVPFLIDGTVNPATGALAPPVGFNINVLGGPVAAFPGLVMFDNEGVTKFTPGTFAGTIAAGATSGTWQTGPAPLITGTFTGNLLP